MALSAAGNGGTVVVTGGAGFIGVNLAPALAARGWRTLAFDDLSTGTEADATAAGYDDLVVGDIRDRAAMTAAFAGADAVVHLAAQAGVPTSIADPFHDHELNVLGTLNALVAARDAGVRSFTFASSNAPLGEVEPPTRETIVPRPLSPYGASKLAGEAYCSAFAGSFGLRTVVLRFANVYGPFSYHKGSVVASFMKAATSGEPLVIHGDGSQTRDLVYVGDLCDGIARAVGSGSAGEIFHLGSGREVAIGDVAELVRSSFGDRPLEVRHEPMRTGDVHRSCSDISKARRVLGFAPSMALEDGLAATRDWFLTTA